MSETYYQVTNPTFDEPDNTVTLPISPSSLEEASPGYVIAFGTDLLNQDSNEKRFTVSNSLSARDQGPETLSIAEAIRHRFATKTKRIPPTKTKRDSPTTSIASFVFPFQGADTFVSAFGGNTKPPDLAQSGGLQMYCDSDQSCGLWTNMTATGVIAVRIKPSHLMLT